MASFTIGNMVFTLLLCLSAHFHLIFGTQTSFLITREIICEELPVEVCALSIASSGKRCLLENYRSSNGETEFQCRTSEVVVEKIAEWIETDECVWACGVDRNAAGISSDALHDPHFTAKLCSAPCYHSCPNIVDLYFNLAAGEGVFLPDLCKLQRANPRRAMAELMSSGVAEGPGANFAGAPLSTVAGIALAPTPF